VVVSAGVARAAQAWTRLKLRWPTPEVRELVVFLLLVQLMASVNSLALAFGARGFAVLCAGLALVIYAGALRGERFAARRVLGWIGAPWRWWAGAAVVGCFLSALVTAATLSVGHSIRVSEPVHNQVLAVTLGPIVEEICLRGIMVPLLAQFISPAAAVLATSAVFAFLHWPASLLKLASIGATGAGYGWTRILSGSTALAAVAHAAYNLTILVFGL
jgi:membrane protease YdiL (CAAX protease family)